MNSPSASSSHKFKNLSKSQRNSPIEMKEKMRKAADDDSYPKKITSNNNYKDKIQNCRGMLLNRFRGALEEIDLRKTLTEIYGNMYSFSHAPNVDDKEEVEILEEIKNELIQEEFEWWLEEYEKSEMNIDWSALEQENNVICPICEKDNLCLVNSIISCSQCKSKIKTQKSLADAKHSILHALEKHSAICNKQFQFALVEESNESHIFFICSSCSEMQLVI